MFETEVNNYHYILYQTQTERGQKYHVTKRVQILINMIIL